MGLLAQAAGVWLIVIAVEGLFRLFGSETDLTGLGAFVAILMAVAGMLLQFDPVMVGVNVGLFIIWGAVIPPDDDESSDEHSTRPTNTGSTTTRTNSQSLSQSTTETAGGSDTHIFDDTANTTDDTRVYDPNAETTDDTRIYEG